MCAAQSPAKMLQFLAAFRRLSIYTTCLDVGHINSMVQWSYSGNSKAIEARNEALNEAPDGNGNSAVSLCLVSHEAGLMYHQAGHFSRPTSATGRIIPIIRMFCHAGSCRRPRVFIVMVLWVHSQLHPPVYCQCWQVKVGLQCIKESDHGHEVTA